MEESYSKIEDIVDQKTFLWKKCSFFDVFFVFKGGLL